MASVSIRGVDLSTGMNRPVLASDMLTNESGQRIARISLVADTTFYVRTDGSDSNDGLTDSAGGAFLTIQAAVDNLQNYDCSSYVPTIQVQDGTYANGAELGTILGSRTPRMVGNTSTPASVIIQADDTVSSTAHMYVIAGRWDIEGFSFQDAVDIAEPSSANYVSNLVHVNEGALATVGNCRFGPCNVAIIALGGTVRYKDSLFFEDDIRSYAFYASRQGKMERDGGSTITCVNGSKTVGSFLRAEISSTISIGSNVTFVNPSNYSGQQYQLIGLSLLYQFGSPVGGYPGSGTTVTNGSEVV